MCGIFVSSNDLRFVRRARKLISQVAVKLRHSASSCGFIEGTEPNLFIPLLEKISYLSILKNFDLSNVVKKSVDSLVFCEM